MFVIFLATFVGLIVIAVISTSKQNETLAKRHEEYAERKREFQTRKADFLEEEFAGQKTYDVKWEGRPTIFSAPDDAVLRVVQLMTGDEFLIHKDRTYSFEDIRSVGVEENDVVERYSRETVTPVAIQKNKSAIGRGLVGGVLLGPVGLALGAASSLTPESRVENVTTTQMDQRIVKGPPTLVITTRDRDNPFVRLEFSSGAQARAWALWIGDQLPA